LDTDRKFFSSLLVKTTLVASPLGNFYTKTSVLILNTNVQWQRFKILIPQLFVSARRLASHFVFVWGDGKFRGRFSEIGHFREG